MMLSLWTLGAFVNLFTQAPKAHETYKLPLIYLCPATHPPRQWPSLAAKPAFRHNDRRRTQEWVHHSPF